MQRDEHHRIARRDVLFFRYRLNRNDAGYILEILPIVREEDEPAFGWLLTEDLVLIYMDAVTNGELTTRVAL